MTNSQASLLTDISKGEVYDSKPSITPIQLQLGPRLQGVTQKTSQKGQWRVQCQSRHLQLTVKHRSLTPMLTILMVQQNDGPGVVENITLFKTMPTTNTANYMLLSGISPGVDHGGVTQNPVSMTAELTTDTRTQTTDSSVLD